MRMDFDGHDEGDEKEAAAVRDSLVQQFAGWLAGRPDHGDVDAWDVDLLLQWKVGYADGDYGWWTRGHIDEFLLEHLPRKLSAPPDDAASFPASIAAFVAFLAEQSLLSERSEAPDVVAARALAQKHSFLDAMADPNNFGMAKRVFSWMDVDSSTPPDQGELDRLMAEFNSLSFEERGRILGLDDDDDGGDFGLDEPPLLPIRPVPPEEELDAVAREVPLVRRVDALHAALRVDGATLDEGLPTSTERARLAAALGVDADGPDLIAAIDIAVEAYAVEYRERRLLAVEDWPAQSLLGRWRDVVDGALQSGASTVRFGEVEPVPTDLAHVADEAAFVFLVMLWIADEPLAVETFVETLVEGSKHHRETAHLQLSDARRSTVCHQRVGEVLATFGDLGLVTFTEAGTMLTDAGAWAVGPTLADFDCDVALPEDIADMSPDELLDSVIERDDDPAIMVETWTRGRDAGALAHDLVASLVADSGSARLVLGFTMLGHIGHPARAAVEAARTGALAPHAWLWLAEMGVIGHDEVPREMGMRAGVDVLLATAELGSPADVIESLVDHQPIELHEGLLDDLAASGHPRTGELLELVGQHHPVKAVGKRARTLAHRWRSQHGRH